MTRTPMIDRLWNCAGGAAFLDRDRNQLDTYYVGRAQDNTARRYIVGDAVGHPDPPSPTPADLMDAPTFMDYILDFDVESGLCRN